MVGWASLGGVLIIDQAAKPREPFRTYAGNPHVRGLVGVGANARPIPGNGRCGCFKNDLGSARGKSGGIGRASQSCQNWSGKIRRWAGLAWALEQTVKP